MKIDILSIHHVAILTSNELYEKSKEFYVHTLGFKIICETFREARNSYKLDLSINGLYQIELFSFPTFRERGSYPECKGLRHLSFSVKDLDHSVKALTDRGVITEPIRVDEITGKRFTFFEDPNQQPLEIYEL
jgi:glyoxylase I family protein